MIVDNTVIMITSTSMLTSLLFMLTKLY